MTVTAKPGEGAADGPEAGGRQSKEQPAPGRGRARRRAAPMETRNGIDLAPMVDIIFLLLAYFLINSTLAKTPAIRIDLPESETASYVGENAIDILVRQDGTLLVNDTEVPADNLAATLKATVANQSDEPEVNIKGDAGAEYQRIIGVIDEVQKAGLNNFNLTTTRR